MQLPFGIKKQGRQSIDTLGCYARDSHEVVDQHACLIQDEELSRIAWSVRDWAQGTGLTVKTGNSAVPNDTIKISSPQQNLIQRFTVK